MTSRISHTSVDCTDAYGLSTWWKEEGSGWVTLADPEGNVFCVLRSVAERTGPPQPG
ncbi:hypothetical protein [Ornithinimicrobium cryptoxanthini]|uniref:Glyoxalase-like domain-containing protein n=1 Tax=Ornithinimicrobium cryptoxanthini TaxID=2934161 RepID=A0ABY4YKE3_9MICO|nr:hypothetical protein [Ornithinimicrobium cryptoxanthini]USQ77089.1 hypothetical protein NF557_04000 [Ornithinimicrobium cryptoxanthini]